MSHCCQCEPPPSATHNITHLSVTHTQTPSHQTQNPVPNNRKLKWGIKLKLDVNKAVVGLAAHPTSSQLLVLYEDGALRGYVMTGNGLQSTWGASYFLPGVYLVLITE